MDALAIDQLLARARAIMMDCLAVAAARTMQNGTKKIPTGCPRDTIIIWQRTVWDNKSKGGKTTYDATCVYETGPI